MQGRSAQAATEDIETVLGRFQAWAGSREAKAAKGGVREISYEEALESSRHRWRGRGESPRPDDPDQRQSAIAGVAGAPAADTLGSPQKEAAPSRTVPENPPVPGVPSGERAESRSPEPFRAALTRSVGTARSTRGAARGEAVCLSLRVNPAEQALIRIRAAEAGISVSAYLRQCALDVEILRAQVQQFMAASTRSRMVELPEPPPARSEGWRERLQRLFRKGRRAQLSLEA